MPVHPNRSPVASGGSGTVAAISNHYEVVHIEVINFPPSQVYVESIITTNSLYSSQCMFMIYYLRGSTEVQYQGDVGFYKWPPWIQEVAPTT